MCVCEDSARYIGDCHHLSNQLNLLFFSLSLSLSDSLLHVCNQINVTTVFIYKTYQEYFHFIPTTIGSILPSSICDIFLFVFSLTNQAICLILKPMNSIESRQYQMANYMNEKIYDQPLTILKFITIIISTSSSSRRQNGSFVSKFSVSQRRYAIKCVNQQQQSIMIFNGT